MLAIHSYGAGEQLLFASLAPLFCHRVKEAVKYRNSAWM